MTAVAGIAVSLAGFLDGLRLEKIELVPVGAESAVAGQAVVVETFPDFGPGCGEPGHHLVIEPAVAHQADLRIHIFAHQRRVTVALFTGHPGFAVGVVALVAGVAVEIHLFPCERCHHVAAMKGFLLTLVHAQGLIPGQGGILVHACGRAGQWFALEDVGVALQALLVGGLVDERFEVDRVPAGLLESGFVFGCRRRQRQGKQGQGGQQSGK